MKEMTTKKDSWRNLAIYIIYINIIIYGTCYQLQKPVEPFLVDKLNIRGDSAIEYARLQSFFGIIQTIGSLLTGKMLDHFGVKGGFLLSFAGSAMSYFLLSQSTTLSILYYSKIPAILQNGFLCAQVAISQLTENGSERVRALGILTMSYTLGSIMGPALGGWLGSNGNYYFGAKLATVGSIISIILTLFIPNVEAEKSAEQGEKNKIKSVQETFLMVWLLLMTKFITSVANSMSNSALPVILKSQFHCQEQSLGFTMSAMSACIAIVNGLFLGPIAHFFGGNLNLLIYTVVVLMGLGYSVQYVIFSTWVSFDTEYHFHVFLLLSFLLWILQYILATTITSESTAQVGAYSKGTLLGLEHSLHATARIATPQWGIMLWKDHGLSSLSMVCSIVFGITAVLWNASQSDVINASSLENSEKKK